MGSKVIGLRVSEDEYKNLELIARRRATSVSAIVYDSVIKLLSGEIKPTSGSVTEEVLEEYLEKLKADLIQELNSHQQVKPSQQDPSDGSKLSCAELSRRLGCNKTTLWRWRNQGKLQQKTKERDPDGKPWKYDPDDKIYVEV